MKNRSLHLEKPEALYVRGSPQTLAEYLIEAACLGAFMISACTFASLLGYPQSPAHMLVMSGMRQRVAMGLAMACTAVVIIYSPWASAPART